MVDKAKAFLDEKRQYEDFLKEKKAAFQQRQEKQAQLGKNEKLYQEYEIEFNAVKEEARNLSSNQAFRLKEQLEEYHTKHDKQQNEKEDCLRILLEKQNRYMDTERDTKTKQDELDTLELETKDILKDMDLHSEGIFVGHEQLCKELTTDMCTDGDLTSLQDMAQLQKKKITDTVSTLKEQQRTKDQLNKHEELLEKEKQKLEDKERELEKYRRLLSETKQELMEKVNQWDETRTLLHLDAYRNEVMMKIDSFSNENGYFEVINIVNGRRNEVEREWMGIRNVLENRKAKIVEAWMDKQAELNAWIEKEDPEPVRSPEVEENRKNLTAAGIPFYPFYKVIEFYPELKDEQKNRLEEALEDMGLLDALIIDEQYRDKVLHLSSGKDRYLFAEAGTIIQPIYHVLEADPQINDIFLSQQIAGILESISGSEKGTTYIDKDGTYGIGILHGKINGMTPARFIGYRSRQAYRETMIVKLRVEFDELNAARNAIENEITEVDRKLDRLNEEFNAFPQGNDLMEAIQMETGCIQERSAILKQVEIYSASVIETQKQLHELYDSIVILQNACGFHGNLEVYTQAEAAMEDYLTCVIDLQKKITQINSANEIIMTYQTKMIDLQKDIDDYAYRNTGYEGELKNLALRIAKIEEQMRQSGYEAIQQRIDACVDRLDELPRLKEKLSGESKVLGMQLEELNVKIGKFDDEEKKAEQAYRFAQECFCAESRLGFLDAAEIDKEPALLADTVLKKRPDLIEQSLQDIFQSLATKYHENKDYLSEYNLIQEEKEVSQGKKRTFLIARLSGVKVSFYGLYQQIKDDIEIQTLLLSNKERELFEDILANTLGKKIRYKIQKSKEWVKMMNESMSQMDNSNHLLLSLEWKNKQAEEEGQLGTKELVSLLEMDSETMNDAQMKKLAQHFRSKLAQARKRAEEKENTQTLHSIMREIFDYRNWFEFQLYYEKGAEKRKEMTNARFLTFSGGEKAISMYVPLFSAAEAKYSGAREDAPRLICLDEAFAGVDDRNIGNMFKMMNDCQFQFILNSQNLWGDYETNPGMSIYQLETDMQHKFVATVHYIWNGKKRILTDDTGIAS